MTAKLIQDNLDGYNGHAALYKLTPPLDGHEFVVVSSVVAMFSGPETFIFSSDSKGKITDYLELDGSQRGTLTHSVALKDAGYDIIRKGK